MKVDLGGRQSFGRSTELGKVDVKVDLSGRQSSGRSTNGSEDQFFCSRSAAYNARSKSKVKPGSTSFGIQKNLCLKIGSASAI